MKKAVAAGSLAAVLLLSGCAAVDRQLGEIFLEESGIKEREEYIRYEQYQEAGNLDESGQYVLSDEQLEEALPQEPDGQIHVSFADNRYLKILYYTDADMLMPISTSECYLNPGDTIYARLEECKNPNSNLYRLAEYRIKEYDEAGNVRNEYVETPVENVMEYTIPENFTGTELSVFPVGEYADRQISMRVYYVDDSGKECDLGNAGTWFINEEAIHESTAQISSLEAYVLKFEYDTDNYFYVSSGPECFTKDPADAGFVEFWAADPTDADTAYQVELHPYLTLDVKCSEKAQICVGDREPEELKKNEVWNGEKLRYGDQIIIETTGECTITDGDYRHIRATKDPITNGYRYTLKVVEEPVSNAADDLLLTVDVDRVFDVTLESSCDYGVCTYKLDGEEVSGKIRLQEGQELILTYKITRDNYVFANKSEGIGGFFHDLVNGSQRKVTIPITADLQGTVIDPDDWFEIAEKED